MFDAMTNRYVVPVAYFTCSCVLIVASVVAIIVVGGHGIPSAVPNLFAGLLVFGVMGMLLSIPLIHKVWSKQKRKQQQQEAAKGVKNQVESQVWPPPWSREAASLCEELAVRPAQGLAWTEASARLQKYGANRVEVQVMPGYFAFFVKEIYEPTQLLLLCVGGLYVMFGSIEEGVTAFIVIFLLVIAEVGTEWRAKRALASLKLSTPHDAVVRREGQLQRIPACNVVPGDVVQLGVGMEVPADIRVLQSHFLAVDESKMTGESIPVPKDPFALHPEEASLLERTNIATAGSLVTKGTGFGLVFQTGLSTSLGQVLMRSRKVKEKKTKLQVVLKEIAWVLSMAALGASTVGALLGVLKQMRWQDVLLSGLSLAFATIPEELPILIAAVLAVGSQSLSRKNVYVKRLRAAENLGFVDTVLTDKTGTLTENKLKLHSLHFGSGLDPRESFSSGNLITGLGTSSEAGLNYLLEAWIFMSDMGEDLEEYGEHKTEALHNLVKEADEGVPQGEEVVDEIHLDVMPLVNSVELLPTSGDRAAEDLGNHPGAVSGDVFDRAIMKGLGVSIQESASSSGKVYVANNPHIQEYLQIACSSKAGAKLLDDIPFCSKVKYASRMFNVRVDSSSRDDVSNLDMHDPHHVVVYIKGAPELLLRNCLYTLQEGQVILIDAVRKSLEEQILGAASAGLRLIGYARSAFQSCKDTRFAHEEVFKDIVFLGFLAFQDSVREGAAEAVEKCRQAGVRVIMVTGDHLETGLAVASAVRILDLHSHNMKGNTTGISCSEVKLKNLSEDETQQLVCKTSVFARATPDDKLIILKTLQGFKKCVMATGDGFNDAPILAEANVGVAMGKGTDVAREAASIVFVDDNFAMVPYALAEGRKLLDNLRKALAFYLGAKLGLISLFIIGTLWQSFPLSAIQIIVLELFMDLGASTSFVMEPADSDIMHRPPYRSTDRFFNHELLGGILVSAVCMTLTVLLSFAYGIHAGDESAQTSAFLAWLLSHVLLAFNMRTIHDPVYRKGVLSNPAMLVWLISAVSLGALIAVSATIRHHLKLVSLPASQWLAIATISVAGTAWVELLKCIRVWWLRRLEIAQELEKHEEQSLLLPTVHVLAS